MKKEMSAALFKKASARIPGGVNSPVRACGSVNADPLFIRSARGSRLWDADGNEFIDYVGSWGPMILGHSHPEVVKAVQETIELGMSFGAPCEQEILLADMIADAVPSVEKVRMVNSGTEATMSAIRLARAYTGRQMIVKFDGCYHGHGDTLLVEAGSGVATLSIPGTPGVPEEVVKNTLSLPYNDEEAVQSVMDEKGKEIACIIVEPVAGNMGLVPPQPGYLETLREICDNTGTLLIFDEVISGFRVAYGGAQSFYSTLPDITCLGKIIGGGLPVGAYGGREEIMNLVAPEGNVYQAGTLSGNPLAMAAGAATLSLLKNTDAYDVLEERAGALMDGIIGGLKQTGIPAQVNRVGSLLGLFFTEQDVNNFADAKTCDLARFSLFYRNMRDRGIYIAPSQFEAIFVSAAHSEADIEKTIEAFHASLEALKAG